MGAASSWCSSALIKEQYLEEWIFWYKRQMVELLLVVTAEFLVVVWWSSSATLTSCVSSSLETVPLWRIVLGPLPFTFMLILCGSHSPACPPSDFRFPPVKETNTINSKPLPPAIIRLQHRFWIIIFTNGKDTLVFFLCKKKKKNGSVYTCSQTWICASPPADNHLCSMNLSHSFCL